MKKFAKIIAVLALVGIMAGVLAACNSMPKIKAAFEREGYTYSQDAADFISKFTEELEEEQIVFNLHVFTKDLSMAAVIEFKSNKELEEQLEKSETLKGLLGDLQKSDIVNGNCVLIPMSLLRAEEQIEIFKNA